MSTKTFAYEPLAAEVSEQYPHQRWFRAGPVSRGVHGYRDGEKNHCELGVSLHRSGVDVRIDVHLKASEARDLAALLLSMADDIEQHPARANEGVTP